MATCWQIVTRALHELGGSATAAQVELRIGGAFYAARGLESAAKHGLVKCSGKGAAVPWVLTQKGIDWSEGRLTTAEQRRYPGRESPQFIGMRFVPTWLSALPRGIRITQPEPEAA
jgi:hypothetical protein